MILGLDTSCYTTSLAIVDQSEQILVDRRCLLAVKPGEKGLQQSMAVFQHLQNLPQLAAELDAAFQFRAVIASTTPRPVPGAYLPVFRAGASFGEFLANFLGVPFWQTSHQEGHIRAALFQKGLASEPFLAWHISGGTTELLLVKPGETGYSVEKIGGTSDLQVGQFIDRVGVGLGIGFPAGPQLEQLALQSDTEAMLPVSSKGLEISFSGPAAAAERLMSNGLSGPELARRIFNTISKSLLDVSIQAAQSYKIQRIILVGGVASNQLIRDSLLGKAIEYSINFEFGAKELSSDNAVGVGLLGIDRLKRGFIE